MNERKHTMRKVLLLFLIVLPLGSGCAVLTPSQRTEIEKFGKATAAYSAFPNKVMLTHAELHGGVKLANASTALKGKNALALLDEAALFSGELQDKAARAEQACLVLKKYGDLLSALTADEHTTKLQASAEQLGGSLDKAITQYNEMAGTSIGAFGNAAAAVVRGVGGLYVKRKQTLALRQAVHDGKTAVSEMEIAITGLLDLYSASDPASGLNLIRSARENLRKWYGDVGYKGGFRTAEMVSRDLEKAKAAEELAKTARTAIGKLVAAHNQLDDKLKEKLTLGEAIETVQVFADEVSATKDLYDKLSVK